MSASWCAPCFSSIDIIDDLEEYWSDENSNVRFVTALSDIGEPYSCNQWDNEGVLGSPLIVEDDGLFIDSLSGFPGPFSSYVFKTIGNNGILKMIGDNRDAQFVSVIVFRDAHSYTSFESKVAGTISKNIQGEGWGYDPIFVPENQTKTYAELAEKNKLSHRYESLKKFADWFNNKQE
jgi:XTP/dITP diphosphohydrolase